jgi:hypothetical protein
MKTSGVEPATFRLVTQCLNQLRHRVPSEIIKLDKQYNHVLPVTVNNIATCMEDNRHLHKNITHRYGSL